MNFFLIFYRAFESAFKSLNSVRWKAGISILTILIGSLAIAATFTISKNIDSYVSFLINKNGGPKITILNLSKSLTFTPEDVHYYRKISVVEKAYLSSFTASIIRNGSKSSGLEMVSVSEDNLRYMEFKLKRGRFFSSSSFLKNSNEMVLSVKAAKKLNFNPSLHTHVSVKLKNSSEISLNVIGIIDPSSEAIEDTGKTWVAHPLFEELSGVKIFNEMHVVAKSSNWMVWLEKFSHDYFEPRLDGNLWILNPIANFMERKKQLESFIQISYFLGFLALLAGSIGSTSLMILNVNLRRKEIGLYKSMGFSSWIILFQFSSETSLISLIGGSFGSILGCVIGYYVSLSMFQVGSLSFLAGGIGIASALIVGLVFGLIPAVIAAHTDPVKALQG